MWVWEWRTICDRPVACHCNPENLYYLPQAPGVFSKAIPYDPDRCISWNLGRIFEWRFFTFRFLSSGICRDVWSTVPYDHFVVVFLAEFLPRGSAATGFPDRFIFLPRPLKSPGSFVKRHSKRVHYYNVRKWREKTVSSSSNTWGLWLMMTGASC